MNKKSVLFEVIDLIKDRRPLIREMLCEAILIEMEDKMEKAYQEGLRDGKKEMATLDWHLASTNKEKK